MSSYIKSAIYSEDMKNQSSHYHDCHQIIYIKEGNVELNINGKTKKVAAGDIIIISRFENHLIKILSKTYKRYVLRISVNLPNEDKVFSVFTNRPKEFENVISVGENRNDIESILNKIISECSLEKSMSEQMQNLLINELLIYISRALDYEFDDFNSKNFDLVLNLKSEFENYYYMEFKLEDLAKKYNVSISTLTHTFKKIVGVSPFEYLLSCRMAVAKKLLTKSELTIGEIVEKCGFTDSSNFSRTFKTNNRMTPTDFRKKFKTK